MRKLLILATLLTLQGGLASAVEAHGGARLFVPGGYVQQAPPCAGSLYGQQLLTPGYGVQQSFFAQQSVYGGAAFVPRAGFVVRQRRFVPRFVTPQLFAPRVIIR